MENKETPKVEEPQEKETKAIESTVMEKGGGVAEVAPALAIKGGKETHTPEPTVAPEYRAWRTGDGAVAIEAPLRPAVDRKGYERQIHSAREFGLESFERLHALGAGTGVEVPDGIRLGPREVNQQFQNHGVEDTLRQICEHKREDVDLTLIAEVRTHEDSLRLESITYRFDGQEPGGERERLFEATIEVENSRENPSVQISAERYGDLEKYLKTPIRT